MNLASRRPETARRATVYLFQWLFGIIGISGAAAACALVATMLESAEARRLAGNASLVLSLAAVTSCFVMVASCTEVTATGIQKKIAKLDAALQRWRPNCPNPCNGVPAAGVLEEAMACRALLEAVRKGRHHGQQARLDRDPKRPSG